MATSQDSSDAKSAIPPSTTKPDVSAPVAESNQAKPLADVPQTENGTSDHSVPEPHLLAPKNGEATVTAAALEGTKEDSVNPPDFHGEVQTTNDLPTPETIRRIEDYTVLDRDGKSHSFKSLYSGHNVARRVLIIFIRHFFCGLCQEYLRSLAAAITPDSLLELPVSTFIAVVGCGSYELIDSYIHETKCPFPVYADQTRRLYTELGMVRTLSLGSRPAYLQDRSVAHTVLSGIKQGLKQVRSGLVTKMGDQRQVGGEFLFEPASLSLDGPIAEVVSEFEGGAGHARNSSTDEDDPMPPADPVEEKRVTWCHRMKTTRDHAEVPEIMEVLGIDSEGKPLVRDPKKWAKALKVRKGTGLSMATQMSRMSMDSKAAFSIDGGRPTAPVNGDTIKEDVQA
ncbi:AhpC/TSA antioxidant enzyme-domain-containing protein [Xylariomycetidae sp. FL0641]|nr:AhpC/TSA antioxidant enzyme-domain-containing protein [Xylariomycetidae sp. FL0641]